MQCVECAIARARAGRKAGLWLPRSAAEFGEMHLTVSFPNPGWIFGAICVYFSQELARAKGENGDEKGWLRDARRLALVCAGAA